MIVDEPLTIRWNARTRPYYESLGYAFSKVGDEFVVSSLHLSPGSGVKVLMRCETCGNERRVQRSKYREVCAECARSSEERREKCRQVGLRRKEWFIATMCEPEVREKAGRSISATQRRRLSDPATLERARAVARERGLRMRGTRTTKTRDERLRERSLPEYGDWRLAVYRRDGFVCKICGKRGGRLNAHHVFNFADFPDLRLVVENGITMCAGKGGCHNEFHRIYGNRHNGYLQLEEFLAHKRKEVTTNESEQHQASA